MKNIIELLKKSGASDAAGIPYEHCEILNQSLANKIPFTPKTVIIGIVPYYTHFCDMPHTISTYALAYDYHSLLRQICDEAIRALVMYYPNSHFVGFADHSPINEKLAAAKAGLGIIGDHSLLITEKHSSFVFLFEIFTDLAFDISVNEIKYCEHCGACKKICPTDISNKKVCVSAITQKKGELSEEETQILQKSKSAWGCDLCQMICPHTKKAISENTIYTDSKWFNSNILPNPNENTVKDSFDFNQRAYSWRGTQTILRNLSILNNDN